MMELIADFLGLRLSDAPEERKVARCELSKGPMLPTSRGSLSVFLAGLVSFLAMCRGHVDGFFPPRPLSCLDSSKLTRGGQAGPANLKLFLEEGRAAFIVLWNPNAFSCRPDKITGLLNCQRSDFPRNQPRAPGSSRLAVRSLRASGCET